MAFKWTPRQIDDLTFPEYEDIRNFWNSECPPVHRMIAHYLGFKKKRPEATEKEREASMESLLSTFGLGPLHISKLSG